MVPLAEAYTFCKRMLNSKTSFRSPGFFKHDDLLMRVLWGSWLPTSLQLTSVEVTSGVAHSHNTRQETREATRRINNTAITVSLPMFRVVAYRLPVLHLVNRASGVLICFICLWVNIMVLALNPGPHFAAITGNPAGLLLWRIWYSVGESGVLGITEYRQGRPLRGRPAEAVVYSKEPILAPVQIGF